MYSDGHQEGHCFFYSRPTLLKSDEGRTVSLWEATASLIDKPAANQALETDVGIIGGVIAGLTAEYLLSERGHRPIVVDGELIGGLHTCRTTAPLSNAI